MRERRRAVDPEAAAAAAEGAARHLAAAPEFLRAARVASYCAVRDELSTAPLLEIARRAGKEILLPRAPEAADRLAFAPHLPDAALSPGRYGVPEPTTDAVPALGPSDVVVVPGMAFDLGGNRLGTGGGWYDRTFPNPDAGRDPWLVGFAYAVQVVDAVPHGPHDRRMDAIVTERGLYRVPGAERRR